MNSYTGLSDVYDALMYDVNYDEWAEYIDRLITKYAGSGKNIYEAGCGTGSISVRLAKKGYKLISADISGDMLEQAAENMRAEGVSIRFIEQDMRRISCTGKKDAVIACCDAANYLLKDEELLDFIFSAYSSLREGGVLLFDVSSSYKLKNVLGNNFFYDDGDEVTCFWQSSFDEAAQCVKLDVTIFEADEDVYARSDEQHILRAYGIDTLLKLLTSAGFKEVHAFDFLTEDAPSESADRIQLAGVK